MANTCEHYHEIVELVGERPELDFGFDDNDCVRALVNVSIVAEDRSSADNALSTLRAYCQKIRDALPEGVTLNDRGSVDAVDDLDDEE